MVKYINECSYAGIVSLYTKHWSFYILNYWLRKEGTIFLIVEAMTLEIRGTGLPSCILSFNQHNIFIYIFGNFRECTLITLTSCSFLVHPLTFFPPHLQKIPPSPVWVVHTLVVAWSNFLKVDHRVSMCDTLGSTSCTNEKQNKI